MGVWNDMLSAFGLARNTGHPPPAGCFSGNGLEDRLSIVGFNSKAFPVLLPTRLGDPGVAARIRELADARRFKGGCTNLSAALHIALGQARNWKGSWIRRVLIVSDGEPNEDTDRLPMLAARAQALRTGICAIHVGNGNNAVLQDLVRRTRGGWFETAYDFGTLARSVERAGQVDRGGNGRRSLVIMLVDLSSSMATPFSGAPRQGRRIDGLVEAALGWQSYHARTFGQYVGRTA